jgi:hypothetical protein
MPRADSWLKSEYNSTPACKIPDISYTIQLSTVAFRIRNASQYLRGNACKNLER